MTISARIGIFLALGLVMYLASCATPSSAIVSQQQDSLRVRLAKWQYNRSSAVSMTFDHTWGSMQEWELWLRRTIADSALPVDFDYTSGYIYDTRQQRCAADTLSRRLGITFFAHGHLHVNTDMMSYDEAKANFLQCRDSMLSLGLKPLIYAYPGGYGYSLNTRNAARDAGFLAARMFSPLESPYILPDDNDITTTLDWYKLPTLTMFSQKFHAHSPLLRYTNTITHNTQELIPFLEENIRHHSWLILTYHAIARLDEENSYEASDYLTDISAVRARGSWFARMQEVVLFLREKASARLRAVQVRNNAGMLEKVFVSLDDGLLDNVYDVPLTVLISPPSYWQNMRLIAFPEANPDARQILIPTNDNDWILTIKPDGKQYIVIAE